jgi:ribosomal protein S18 acetylase RimI-like enzyme
VIRRLGPEDEDVVRALATREPHTALLTDPRTIFLVAFEEGEPAGFVLAYELLRRHGDPTSLFVYEVDVAEAFRRRGIARELLRALAKIAAERGIRRGFVLTERSNEPAMRLYEAAGGAVEGEDVVWEFEYKAS